MNLLDFRPVFYVLTVGFLGAAIATVLNLPAAALLGSSITVSIFAFFYARAFIPDWLKNIAFTAIGCSLGSGVTSEALAQASRWPLSLVALGFMIIVLMFVCSRLLIWGFQLPLNVAALGTSPGALSYVLALATGQRNTQNSANEDVSVITALQTIRLLVITIALPFIIEAVNLFVVGDIPQIESMPQTEGTIMSVFSALFVMGIVYLVGIAGTKLGIPAAFIIFGMIINGGFHVSDVFHGPMPQWILFVGFVVTGAVTGVRFKTISAKLLKKILWAALVTVSVGILIAALFAILVSYWLHIPFGQVWVAFAPGGVETMAAMSLSLGYDSAYVAVHHLFRIIFLILFLPLFLRISLRS